MPEAANGGEALEILARPEPVSVLLTDIVIPNVNGLDLARRVRRDRPEIRVLSTSGMSDPARVAAQLSSDAEILPKPCELEEIERPSEFCSGPKQQLAIVSLALSA